MPQIFTVFSSKEIKTCFYFPAFYAALAVISFFFSVLPEPIVWGPVGEAISLNIFNVTAMQRRSALGPADQSRAPLCHPVPNAELTEISASPEMAPLPQIAFHICVRMSTTCMFNM